MRSDAIREGTTIWFEEGPKTSTGIVRQIYKRGNRQKTMEVTKLGFLGEGNYEFLVDLANPPFDDSRRVLIYGPDIQAVLKWTNKTGASDAVKLKRGEIIRFKHETGYRFARVQKIYHPVLETYPDDVRTRAVRANLVTLYVFTDKRRPTVIPSGVVTNIFLWKRVMRDD